MIEMPANIREGIPEVVIRKLSAMDELTQEAFLTEFKQEKKSALIGFILLLLCPGWHYFYIGKVWMNLLFWITLGGFFFWWFIDLFRVSEMVRDYNKTVAIGVLKEIQFLN